MKGLADFMIKGFRLIAMLTVVSRVFGMLRDMAFAYFLGAGLIMDIWVIAFKIPNLARRIFGEGAATSSFIPVYSDQLKKDRAAAYQLAHTVVTVIVVLLTGVALAGLALIAYIHRFHAPLESTRLMLVLAALMLPYMVMICAEAILAGILNTHRHFAAPAAAPIVLNIVNITTLCVGGWVMGLEPEQHVFLLAFGVLAAGVIQVGIQMAPMRRLGLTLRPAWQVHSEAFKRILWLMGPMILGMAVTQLNTLADDIIAKSLSGSVEKGTSFVMLGREIRYPVWAGSVAGLFYAQRLYQFPLGVLGISLATAIFPVLSDAAADQDDARLADTTQQGLQAAIFLALPSTAGLILIARPLVAAIYQRGRFTAGDTELASGVLICYALGLCGYFVQQILPRVFYALKNSEVPARTAVIAVVLNVILNLTLIWPMGAAGLALSTAICSYAQAGILLWLLHRRMGIRFDDRFGSVLSKTLLGTGVMAAVGWAVLAAMGGLAHSFRMDVVRVLATAAVCVGVYAAAAAAMGNPMLALIVGARRRNNKRR
ncbi:MAG TPA: murein biosynthesis integral membrane protein MurJ [Phycisphaerales bacterium]|nr:murein biosynthesis integral membrane protein MurJ [Phycisphaerales bacterium]